MMMSAKPPTKPPTKPQPESPPEQATPERGPVGDALTAVVLLPDWVTVTAGLPQSKTAIADADGYGLSRHWHDLQRVLGEVSGLWSVGLRQTLVQSGVFPTASYWHDDLGSAVLARLWAQWHQPQIVLAVVAGIIGGCKRGFGTAQLAKAVSTILTAQAFLSVTTQETK
jgi:hypothetical protein